MEQKEFSVRDTATSFISAAKEHSSLIFKNDPSVTTSYQDMKTKLQNLSTNQQAEVMGYVRNSAIRVNGQEPDKFLSGYGILRTVYSDVLTDMLDEKCANITYAARNGNHDKTTALRKEMEATLKGLPNDQLADLNGNIATFHEAKDFSNLETLPQLIHTKALEEAESLVTAEVTSRQDKVQGPEPETPIQDQPLPTAPNAPMEAPEMPKPESNPLPPIPSTIPDITPEA